MAGVMWPRSLYANENRCGGREAREMLLRANRAQMFPFAPLDFPPRYGTSTVSLRLSAPRGVYLTFPLNIEDQRCYRLQG